MCELLIVTINPPIPYDRKIAPMMFRAGMVVAIHEDGVPWGAGDLSGHARIVKLPGVPAKDLNMLISLREAEDAGLGAPSIPRGIRYWKAKSSDLEPVHYDITDAAKWVEMHFNRQIDP